MLLNSEANAVVRKLAGLPRVRHVFWQTTRLRCRFLVEMGDLYLESDDLEIQPANEWEQQAFDSLAELKGSSDSGPLDQSRINALDSQVLKREQRLGKALSVERLITRPVLLKAEGRSDKHAYALYDGAIWRSDLTENLGRQEIERFFRQGESEQPCFRTAIPAAVRQAVWRRDEGRCAKCGRRERLEFDHIVPISRGGANTERNIELLCELCNRAKSDRIE